MKIARLPDGQMMEFPPELPDDEMDRLVRQKMIEFLLLLAA